MKKLLLLTAAALLLAVPELKAQDAEEETPAAGEEKTEAADGEKKTGDQKAGDKKADKKADKTAAKDNVFAGQQKKIQTLMNKLAKAKKKTKRSLESQLKREQFTLRKMYMNRTKPIQARIDTLKEQIRIKPGQAEKLEKEIASLEEKLKSFEEAADLEKWCPDIQGGKEKSDKKNKKE